MACSYAATTILDLISTNNRISFDKTDIVAV